MDYEYEKISDLEPRTSQLKVGVLYEKYGPIHSNGLNVVRIWNGHAHQLLACLACPLKAFLLSFLQSIDGDVRKNFQFLSARNISAKKKEKKKIIDKYLKFTVPMPWGTLKAHKWVPAFNER